MDKAVVFGVGGQDGSFLAEALLRKGYRVYGARRRSGPGNCPRLQPWVLESKEFSLHTCDITDIMAVYRLLQEAQPDYIYNLAAQSHVGTSFNECLSAIDVTFKGCANILEAYRAVCPKARFYQASSSEMFGNSFDLDLSTNETYQDEKTRFNPCSPYAVNKLAAHNLVSVFRKSYNCWACSGILFNHESERRGYEFVTRKITRYAGHLYNYLHDRTGRFPRPEKLRLGNIEAHRDWGYAPEYVKAMILMMEREGDPMDFVVATGKSSTIREFLHRVFLNVGADYREWVITDDAQFNRPNDVVYLRGRSDLIKKELGWFPKRDMCDIADIMFQKDCEDILTKGPDSAIQTY